MLSVLEQLLALGTEVLWTLVVSKLVVKYLGVLFNIKLGLYHASQMVPDVPAPIVRY